MAHLTKECKKCGQANHFRVNTCFSCGGTFKPGRPQKTTGLQVSHSGGRPCNTSEEADYGVGVSGSLPRGNKWEVEFHDSIQLPPDWDHSGNLANVDELLACVLVELYSSVLLTRSHLHAMGVGTSCGVVLMVLTPCKQTQ